MHGIALQYPPFDTLLAALGPGAEEHELELPSYEGLQDGQWIVWRANRPTGEAEVKRYKDLFARDLVMPSKVELFVMRADGTDLLQLTFNGENKEPDWSKKPE